MERSREETLLPLFTQLRTLTRTCAPIFNRRVRGVPTVALANAVPRRPSRLNASTPS